MRLLNLGCGTTFHPDWINVDIASASKEVQICDIRKKLPFPDDYFDACYSSHVIEHLKQEEANRVLAECLRILQPKSVIRVVVPNLESIARGYLQTLEQVELGTKESVPNYDWMMLELYDQVVRSFPGGYMGRYMSNPNISNQEFVRLRVGSEIDNYLNKQKTKRSLLEKVKSQNLARLTQKLRNNIAEFLILLIAGPNSKTAFKEGIFRNSGEIHQWMYDRFSLGRLLEKSGFVDIRVCRADESRISDFKDYSLDIVDGNIRKPDSLFMEGIKS